VASPPTVSATPTTLSFTYRAGDNNPASQTVQVSGGGGALGFSAQASSAGGWLSVSPTSGTTPATGTTNLSVSVNPQNLNVNTYSGTIVVSGTGGAPGSTTITVTLTVSAPLVTLSAVVSAASFATGSISPGEIVSLFGTNIGPATPVSLTLDSNGRVSTSLGGVQVLMNGTPAPLTYVSSTQVNAVVPYEVAGILHPTVILKFLGASSNGLSLTTAATAPGIFTANGTGKGPGAILNQDYSLNTSNNPVPKGGYVFIYVTGEGQTDPRGVDGKLTTATSTPPYTPQPLLPVAVLVDGQPVNVVFNGEAPGLVSGVMQINIQIPTNARSGTLSLQVSIGGASAQSGVTVAVQ